jgi:hypothetical protein
MFSCYDLINKAEPLAIIHIGFLKSRVKTCFLKISYYSLNCSFWLPVDRCLHEICSPSCCMIKMVSLLGFVGQAQNSPLRSMVMKYSSKMLLAVLDWILR